MFCAYDGYFEKTFKTYIEKIEYIKDLLFITVPNSVLVNDYGAVVSYYNDIELRRNKLLYDIDGIVIKINDYEIRNKLGYTNKYPKFAIAYVGRGLAYMGLGIEEAGCKSLKTACFLGKCSSLEYFRQHGFCLTKRE